MIKGQFGFTVCWLLLTLYSGYLFIIDLNIGILGFLLCWMFGFLGFDMIGNKHDVNVGRNGK